MQIACIESSDFTLWKWSVRSSSHICIYISIYNLVDGAAEDAHKPMPIIEIITKYNDGKFLMLEHPNNCCYEHH